MDWVLADLFFAAVVKKRAVIKVIDCHHGGKLF